MGRAPLPPFAKIKARLDQSLSDLIIAYSKKMQDTIETEVDLQAKVSEAKNAIKSDQHLIGAIPKIARELEISEGKLDLD